MKKTAILIGSLAAIVLLVWVAFELFVGRPLSTDLSRLAQGKPALVLAFENYSPASMDAADLVNQVRGDYEADILFLAADLGVPDGRVFARDHNIHDGMAVLLGGDGSPVQRISMNLGSRELRQHLNQLIQ